MVIFSNKHHGEMIIVLTRPTSAASMVCTPVFGIQLISQTAFGTIAELITTVSTKSIYHMPIYDYGGLTA